MSLYRITTDKLEPISRTTFAAESLLERNDLQRLLRQDISIIGEDLMVIAEEYGEWENSNRRIDLLCLNQRGDLVVVEIKRTEDGGHMDLQAIRYAAMVSSMTLDQAVQTYARTCGREESEARDEILNFLQSASSDDTELTGEVRIILVSADFSTEVAASVLWLNRQNLDIICIRLRPYKMGGEVLVEVAQIIPLPEVADYEIRLRSQEQEKKRASGVWQDELHRFYGHFIRRCQDQFPFLASRSAPKTNKFSFKRGDGYVLLLYTLKDAVHFTCDLKLPSDEKARSAAEAILSERRKSVEEAFGGELHWKQSTDSSIFQIYQNTKGGWGSPESEWPAIQDRLIENLLRLESAIQQPAQELKQSMEASAS